MKYNLLVCWLIGLVVCTSMGFPQDGKKMDVKMGFKFEGRYCRPDSEVDGVIYFTDTSNAGVNHGIQLPLEFQSDGTCRDQKGNIWFLVIPGQITLQSGKLTEDIIEIKLLQMGLENKLRALNMQGK